MRIFCRLFVLVVLGGCQAPTPNLPYDSLSPVSSVKIKAIDSDALVSLRDFLTKNFPAPKIKTYSIFLFDEQKDGQLVSYQKGEVVILRNSSFGIQGVQDNDDKWIARCEPVLTRNARGLLQRWDTKLKNLEFGGSCAAMIETRKNLGLVAKLNISEEELERGNQTIGLKVVDIHTGPDFQNEEDRMVHMQFNNFSDDQIDSLCSEAKITCVNANPMFRYVLGQFLALKIIKKE